MELKHFFFYLRFVNPNKTTILLLIYQQQKVRLHILFTIFLDFGVLFLIQWYINLHGIFNAKAILVEEVKLEE